MRLLGVIGRNVPLDGSQNWRSTHQVPESLIPQRVFDIGQRRQTPLCVDSLNPLMLFSNGLVIQCNPSLFLGPESAVFELPVQVWGSEVAEVAEVLFLERLAWPVPSCVYELDFEGGY